MKVFELKDGIIQVDPDILTVPEFHAVWKKDKTKNKDKAFKELAYIYHMCDYNSPYSNFPVIKREISVREDVIGDKLYKPSKEVKAAVEKYQELTITPKQRLYTSCKRKLDELAGFMDTTPVDDDTMKPILEMFNKLTATIANFDKLEEAVSKEQKENNTKRRGERTTALFED
jgi:hypothetical protein